MCTAQATHFAPTISLHGIISLMGTFLHIWIHPYTKCFAKWDFLDLIWKAPKDLAFGFLLSSEKKIWWKLNHQIGLIGGSLSSQLTVWKKIKGLVWQLNGFSKRGHFLPCPNNMIEICKGMCVPFNSGQSPRAYLSLSSFSGVWSKECSFWTIREQMCFLFLLEWPTTPGELTASFSLVLCVFVRNQNTAARRKCSAPWKIEPLRSTVSSL